MKIAVIDLGFNTAKLACYHLERDNSYSPYLQEGITVRLGEELDRRSYIETGPMKRTIYALKLFREMINFEGIKQVLPVATSAVREAKNKAEFLSEVHRQTGFRFKVLSGTEEAIYSSIGALRATCHPTSLFFDLGGGSLELIYTENFVIKKIRSLPLGALRLTLEHAKNDGTFSRRSYAKLEEQILSQLPAEKDFNLHPDTVLVGVGGSLRAMARVDQQINAYPLDKLHNYTIDYDSVATITKDLSRMDVDDLSRIKAIGNNRAQTITAGSCVIKNLMERFGFNKIVVSAHGLREGVVSVFAHDPKVLISGSIRRRSTSLISSACRPKPLPKSAASVIDIFFVEGLLRKSERAILALALEILDRPRRITNLHNLFYIILDEDLPYLSHREQLILALAILHTQKEKTAEWLFDRYVDMLKSQNMKSIEKISALCRLCRLLEKTKATSKTVVRDGRIEFSILIGSQPMPVLLLENALKMTEKAFEVAINYQVIDSKIPQSRLAVRVR